MRYYYDCPITAAFMAKYHHFVYVTNIHEIFENLCTTDPEVASASKRFYLHDRSVKDLELQIGDIIESVINEDLTEYGEVYQLTDSPLYSMRIIQRNNKPFITPKQENQHV